MRTTTGTHARTARRHLALTGLTGVVVIALAACGSGSTPASSDAGASSAAVAAQSSASAAPSAGSSTKSSASSSAKASGSSSRTPSATELTRRIASASRAKGSARLTMTSAASGQLATGVMRFKSSGADFSMTAALPAGKRMKMVVVGGTAYMNVGEKYQGKNWIRIAPGGSDPLSKVLGPMLAQLGTGADLDVQLAGVKDAKITSATRTAVGGVPATKYTLVSSEKALLAQLEKFAPAAEVREALRAQFEGAHAESVMWIGDGDLPLRVDSRVVGGKAPGTTSTVTYSDWGKPVSISAPPRGDTVSVAG